MTTVGLYIYKITIHNTQTHRQVAMSSTGQGGLFSKFLPVFLKEKSKPVSNSAIKRSWVFQTKKQNPTLSEGLIKYGTFGHTSEIVDPQSGKSLFSRADHHIEEIPLYFQYFIGTGRSYAMCAFQSYRTWSCVTTVNGELTSDFRTYTGDTLYPKFQKVMPSEIALYANSDVKNLTMRKTKVKRDKFDVLRGLSIDDVNVEMNFSVRRRGAFGRLKDVTRQLQENSANNLLLQHGLDFDQVTATVRVGNTYKKVGVLGPAVNAGVIDVSDDVQIRNGHPTFTSISRTASSTISEFVRILG